MEKKVKQVIPLSELLTALRASPPEKEKWLQEFERREKEVKKEIKRKLKVLFGTLLIFFLGIGIAGSLFELLWYDEVLGALLGIFLGYLMAEITRMIRSLQDTKFRIRKLKESIEINKDF